MSFAESRAELAAQLGQLADLLRQAQGLGRAIEARVEAVAGQTETLADDTMVAQVGAAARRARQELGALSRTVEAARAAASKQ